MHLVAESLHVKRDEQAHLLGRVEGPAATNPVKLEQVKQVVPER